MASRGASNTVKQAKFKFKSEFTVRKEVFSGEPLDKRLQAHEAGKSNSRDAKGKLNLQDVIIEEGPGLEREDHRFKSFQHSAKEELDQLIRKVFQEA